MPSGLMYFFYDKCPKIGAHTIPSPLKLPLLSSQHSLRHLVMIMSRSLALLFLQASLVVLTRSEPFGPSSRPADDDAYNQMQDLFASARSTAVDILQISNGSCTEANVKIRREW